MNTMTRGAYRKGERARSRVRGGRPNGRTEIGATVQDVKKAYELFCIKHGLPMPRKWQPRKAVAK